MVAGSGVCTDVRGLFIQFTLFGKLDSGGLFYRSPFGKEQLQLQTSCSQNFWTRFEESLWLNPDSGRNSHVDSPGPGNSDHSDRVADDEFSWQKIAGNLAHWEAYGVETDQLDASPAWQTTPASAWRS